MMVGQVAVCSVVMRSGFGWYAMVLGHVLHQLLGPHQLPAAAGYGAGQRPGQ